MKRDADFVALVSLQEHWSLLQRQEYGLFPDRKLALNFLVRITGQDYGYNLIRWSLYYLLQEQNWIGIEVLWGTITGANARDFQRCADIWKEISIYLQSNDWHKK